MALMNPEGTEKWQRFVAANNAGGVNRPAKTRKTTNTEKKDVTPKGNPEEQLTMDCYAAFLKKYPEYHKRLWHTANENFVRETGGKRKAMGVLSGVADFKLDIPATIDGVVVCGLDIELKYGHNSQQLSQKEFEDYSLATWHIYRVVKSVPDFMECIDKYMACVDPSIHAAIKRLYAMWQPKWEEYNRKKEQRAQRKECSDIAARLGIDPSRIHGLD